MFVSAFSPNLTLVPAMISGLGVAAVVEEGDEDEALNLIAGIRHFCRLSPMILSRALYLNVLIWISFVYSPGM